MTTITLEIPTWGLWLLVASLWGLIILEGIGIWLRMKLLKLHK